MSAYKDECGEGSGGMGTLRTVVMTAFILPAMTTPTRMNPINRRHPSISRDPWPEEIHPLDRNARIRVIGSSSAVTRCLPRT